MTVVEFLFWLCALGVLYTYLIYPLLLGVWARLVRQRVVRDDAVLPSVSIVVAAYNEAGVVGRRVRELCGHLADLGVAGEIIVVSDGSTDGTAEVARAAAVCPVVVLDLTHNVGKAAALSRGAAMARYEILVFADARQTWAPDALKRLLGNFADPTVGAASGDLVIEKAPGVLGGVGFYWHFEKWLRRQEGRVHSCVGATGSISAVRRELFEPIPAGTLLDDVYWPLNVALRGFRVVHDRHAIAFDRLPDRVRDEFRRKVRTLSGNFQLLTLLPAAFVPFVNPVWFQLVSHKMMRLVVPWLLLAMLVLSLSADGLFYRAMFALQATAYIGGVLGLERRIAKRVRPASLAASFLVLNAAAWLGFWVWASGRASRAWSKVAYPAELAPERPAGKLAG